MDMTVQEKCSFPKSVRSVCLHTSDSGSKCFLKDLHINRKEQEMNRVHKIFFKN